MRSSVRGSAALVSVMALVALGSMPATADQLEPVPVDTQQPAAVDGPADETPSPDEDAAGVVVKDAQFRWGFNNESSNAAFAPGTYNLFSAGEIGNPGTGGQTLRDGDSGATWGNGRAAGWSAEVGNVAIEKWNGTKNATATWAGLRTDASNASIAPATSDRFSGHSVVIEGGTGQVDAAGESAEITWDGDFTVLYYSGMTFFYVADPVLSVEDGIGTVTATLSGFESDQNDTSKWTRIPPAEVTLADLGEVDLSDPQGLTATPMYAGIEVKGADVYQVTTGEHWGSFPQSFIDFQVRAGAAPYWYSSGGATDRFKPATPLSVSYDATRPVTPTPPPTGGGGDTVTNKIVQPPARAPALNTPNPPVAPVVSQTAANLAPDAASAPPADLGTPLSAFSATTDQSVTLMAASASTPSGSGPWWWLSLLFLTLAAVTIVGSFALTPRPTRTPERKR